MVELIDNTFRVLTKVAKSKTGMLLRINNSEALILSFVGDDPGKYDEFKRSLLNLHKISAIDDHSVESLPAYKSVKSNLGIHSCFIQNVFSLGEKNEVVYLILFCNEVNKPKFINDDAFMSILSFLSTQIKELYQANFNKNNILQESDTKIDKDFFTNNREENFNKLLSISDDLIFILDKDGCFKEINESGAMLLDYKEGEILGKHFLEFIPPENSAEVASAIDMMLNSKKVASIKTDLKSKLDRQISFVITGRTILKDDVVIGLFGIGKDETKINKLRGELKKLKPKLIEAQRLISVERARVWQQYSLIEELERLKSEFVSNISHEFRTPLASIVGFSETIVTDPNLPDEMKAEFNRVIFNEGKRLAKMINDILDISSIEGGKITLNKSNLDIVQMLEEIVDNNRESAKKKKISFEFDHNKQEIIIEADKEKLAKAFDALINNAIKFTNEDGRVKVTLNNLFKDIEVVISDTGIGIPEKDLPYMFQKFYRVSRPGTEIPGTGVGLVFVKQIIDLHKGLISIQSELGNGTSFIVKLLKNMRVTN
ncbi:MAG: PAS domain-containing sensor histidine kinase [Ignavibacteria bacterium]|nr:PAS domain-containing sensor histidine kinase [Ignavibacteria bacterium]